MDTAALIEAIRSNTLTAVPTTVVLPVGERAMAVQPGWTWWSAQEQWSAGIATEVTVTTEGLVLRTPGTIARWPWTTIDAIDVLDFDGDAQTLLVHGEGEDGPRSFMVGSEASPLTFLVWAVKRNPNHPQLPLMADRLLNPPAEPVGRLRGVVGALTRRRDQLPAASTDASIRSSGAALELR